MLRSCFRSDFETSSPRTPPTNPVGGVTASVKNTSLSRHCRDLFHRTNCRSLVAKIEEKVGNAFVFWRVRFSPASANMYCNPEHTRSKTFDHDHPMPSFNSARVRKLASRWPETRLAEALGPPIFPRSMSSDEAFTLPIRGLAPVESARALDAIALGLGQRARASELLGMILAPNDVGGCSEPQNVAGSNDRGNPRR